MKMANNQNIKKQKQQGLTDAATIGGTQEVVDRYGSAAKEHLVAFSGVDNETGTTLKRSLDSISKQKIHPDYEFANRHQQAGFSAELKETANTNAENIIKGSPIRKVRTDDIGRVNDPLHDHVLVDGNGNIIEGSGSQMKFIGESANDPTGVEAGARLLSGLKSKKFEKYLDGKTSIDVPSDRYEAVIEEADKHIAKVQKELASPAVQGNEKVLAARTAELEKLEKIKAQVRKSSVSTKEALEARNNPLGSTAVDMGRIAHRAGVEGAKAGAVIGGGISLARNIYDCYKGKINTLEAAKNILKDTAKAGAMGYGAGAGGATIKALMQNSASKTLQAASKTNLPGTMAILAINTGRTLYRYFNGEINGEQCLQELGENGANMAAGSLGATIGQALIPVPVVGAIIGGMIGYAISSSCFGILRDAYRGARLAEAERIRIEKLCGEHIKAMEQERRALEKQIKAYFAESTRIFEAGFGKMKEALAINDIDEFIGGANMITEYLGGEVQFRNKREFDQLMLSDTPFVF